ncbi:hypothetical protein ACC861_37705, partial [Rhizobium ruizarguesonis]
WRFGWSIEDAMAGHINMLNNHGLALADNDSAGGAERPQWAGGQRCDAQQRRQIAKPAISFSTSGRMSGIDIEALFDLAARKKPRRL